MTMVDDAATTPPKPAPTQHMHTHSRGATHMGSTHPSIPILFRTPAPAQRPGELPVRSIRILTSSTERCVWNMLEPTTLM